MGSKKRSNLTECREYGVNGIVYWPVEMDRLGLDKLCESCHARPSCRKHTKEDAR